MIVNNRHKKEGKIIQNRYELYDTYAVIYLDRKNKEPLTTIIDLDDLEKIIGFEYKWCAAWRKKINGYYAISTQYIGIIDGKPKYKTTYLHRYIMGVERYIDVDHYNHNTLDNRKENLQTKARSKNAKNRIGKNTNNKSGYRNVCWDKIKEQWMVQLQIDGRNTRLGSFDDVNVAGEYAKEMRQKYYGENAGNG